MTKKIRVLHVVPSFYPATFYGGPIFSTKAICDGVSQKQNFVVEVITTDACGKNVSDRVSVAENPFMFPAGYQVTYFRRIAFDSVSISLLMALYGRISTCDVVHLTATYSFPTIPTLLVSRILRKPVIWSPRGGLQATTQWADSPNKFAKKIFEAACQFVRSSSVTLHVTAEMERLTSIERLRGIAVEIIPNSIEIPDASIHESCKPKRAVRLMFLSRIHEKKGLDILIDVLAELPRNYTLDIYGTGDQEYLARLYRKVSSKGLERRVVFHGHVYGEKKRLAFIHADLFCLPTHSENFGIVVGEALAHGVPVVCSKNAPWSEIEQRGCGKWIDLSKQSFLHAIETIPSTALTEMGQRGRDWIESEFSPMATSKKFIDLYRQVVDRNSF